LSRTLNVAVIFGGRTVEHEISIISARSIISNIDKSKFKVIPVLINKNGTWRRIKKVEGKDMIFNKNSYITPLTNSQKPAFLEKANKSFRRIPVDVIFPVLHGTYGEDGCIQGVFELMNIPYVGANVHGSAIGMDKISMKSILNEYGIPVLPFIGFNKTDWENNKRYLKSKIKNELGEFCFVKSANLGSSIGISKIKSIKQLDSALDYSFRYSERAVVEKAIENPREIEVSVLGNSDPIASVPGEIIPKRVFYDYEAKYIEDSTKLSIPANISKKMTKELQNLALKTYKVLDCSGLGRIDFLVNRKGNKIFISEINTIPGFTQISMYPKLWKLSGISYKSLITKLIELAIEKHTQKNGLQTDYEKKVIN
jgi:D-alanine-D-alanine ligase